jgi:predicted O-linked N-acetylglucosamine transferase (SPINDLY family)
VSVATHGSGIDADRAKRQGEAEAEAADLKLRVQESLARERRLIERTLEAEEKLEDALHTEHELRQQIQKYATFHRAVERSAAWRVIQKLRGLLGREW